MIASPGLPIAGEDICLTNGESLGLSVKDYNAVRKAAVRKNMEENRVSTVCHAPFTTLMFSQVGQVYFCNHAFIPFAQVDPDFSILECWRGEELRKLREQFSCYRLDKNSCKHCIRQIASKEHRSSFPIIQFDQTLPESSEPAYPKHLIFYLGNTCNLACIMCNGILSSRHRKEIEKKPALVSPYGERFFSELEEILPKTEFLEFYGGEPFLVKEHMRIFEILERTKSKCSLFVNTNTTAFHPKAKHYLETLNFAVVAISMDAVHPRLHGEIRNGLDSEKFMHNVKYLMVLRKKRSTGTDERPPLHLMLNVTEHRKNWFDLPEVFRFAEHRQLEVHINTCVHPDNVTLYTLPTEELRYVGEFFASQGKELHREFPDFRNAASYAFMQQLVDVELTRRQGQKMDIGSGIHQEQFNQGAMSDGRLGVPIPGHGPFRTPESLLQELDRMEMLSPATRAHMYATLAQELQTIENPETWSGVSDRLHELQTRL
jgi:wyosine [tRNA(Phe)-imidazoG37] synthetase (radical SAM superfamily)